MLQTNKKITLKGFWEILVESYKKWNETEPFVLSAALSFYAVFSMPALLIVVISTAGILFGREAVKGELFHQIKNLIGQEGAFQVQDMVAKASMNKNGWFAAVISVITILLSATAVFAQLQNTLNKIWDVKVSPRKAWVQYLLTRIFSFGMVAMIGFLLLVSLIISSVLAAFYTWMTLHLSYLGTILINLINNLVSLGLFTLFFAVIFKVLPDVKIRWSSVWVGAVFTAVLFALGKLAIGFYLGTSNPGDAYGAAGSIIVILLWVSYSSLILFFGAVFTNVYAGKFGVPIQPVAFAKIKSGTKNKPIP